MKRLVLVAAALWVGRWALLELASYAGGHWLPRGPAPIDAPVQPGRM